MNWSLFSDLAISAKSQRANYKYLHPILVVLSFTVCVGVCLPIYCNLAISAKSQKANHRKANHKYLHPIHRIRSQRHLPSDSLLCCLVDQHSYDSGSLASGHTIYICCCAHARRAHSALGLSLNRSALGLYLVL